MIAAMQVKPEETSQYGIFRLGGLPKDNCLPVSGMVEKPSAGTAPSSFAAVGRYILDPMIFDVLERTPKGRGGEVQLTDAIALSGQSVPVVAFRFSGTRHDCGNHDGLLAAAVARKAEAQAATGHYRSCDRAFRYRRPDHCYGCRVKSHCSIRRFSSFQTSFAEAGLAVSVLASTPFDLWNDSR